MTVLPRADWLLSAVAVPAYNSTDIATGAPWSWECQGVPKGPQQCQGPPVSVILCAVVCPCWPADLTFLAGSITGTALPVQGVRAPVQAAVPGGDPRLHVAQARSGHGRHCVSIWGPPGASCLAQAAYPSCTPCPAVGRCWGGWQGDVRGLGWATSSSPHCSEWCMLVAQRK